MWGELITRQQSTTPRSHHVLPLTGPLFGLVGCSSLRAGRRGRAEPFSEGVNDITAVCSSFRSGSGPIQPRSMCLGMGMGLSLLHSISVAITTSSISPFLLQYLAVSSGSRPNSKLS